jgi:hypothetical protein
MSAQIRYPPRADGDLYTVTDREWRGPDGSVVELLQALTDVALTCPDGALRGGYWPDMDYACARHAGGLLGAQVKPPEEMPDAPANAVY